MPAAAPTIFGQSTSSLAVPHSFYGMSGWWQVPPTFSVRPFPGGTNQWQCSPNADFSAPVYIASLDADGTYVFQDQLADKIAQNGEQPPGPFFYQTITC